MSVRQSVSQPQTRTCRPRSSATRPPLAVPANKVAKARPASSGSRHTVGSCFLNGMATVFVETSPVRFFVCLPGFACPEIQYCVEDVPRRIGIRNCEIRWAPFCTLAKARSRLYQQRSNTDFCTFTFYIRLRFFVFHSSKSNHYALF